MRQLWQRIAPGHPHDPEWWLGYLRRTYGPEIPLALFTQFAEQGQTLARLEHPQHYRAWFETQCSQRGHRHPVAGALAWLRRRQETLPERPSPASEAKSEPVPLGELLTEVMPGQGEASAESRASAAAADDAVSTRPLPDHPPRRGPAPAARTPSRETGRPRQPSAEAYCQDLRAIYQTLRDRAWPGPTPAGSRRRSPSPHPVTAGLPPATGPPRP